LLPIGTALQLVPYFIERLMAVQGLGKALAYIQRSEIGTKCNVSPLIILVQNAQGEG